MKYQASMILCAALALSACKSVPACEDETVAYVMSQTFIKRALKSPASATFPYITADGVSVAPTTTTAGKCAFTVRTYVDAQNSFGANIRQNFTVTLSPDDNSGRTWSLVEIRPD